jgi:hypothetical protein
MYYSPQVKLKLTERESMNKTEARKLGHELKTRGMSYAQIAEELAKKGYKNSLGNPPRWYDVNYLLNARRYALLNKRRRERIKAEPRIARTHSSASDLSVVKEIAFNDKIDADKRLEIIKIVLEPSRAVKAISTADPSLDNSL